MVTQRSDRIAREQAALRRVATLVARAASPQKVFAAVTEEAGRLLRAHHAWMTRYEPDGAAIVVATWSSTGAAVPAGTRLRLGGRNVRTLVFQTGRPARIDHSTGTPGLVADDLARKFDYGAAVGVPVSVEGRLWGAMVVASSQGEPLPADSEAWLAGFTELVATAIANSQARVELHRFAEEQAALRRVATLVARAPPPPEVFAAVTEEAGRLLGAHHSWMTRYDPDGAARLIATWSSTGAAVPAGTRLPPGGRNVYTLVFQTGRPARIDSPAGTPGPDCDVASELGVRSAVGVPVSVAGRLWGVMVVSCTQEEPLPADTEAWLAGFTELAATALANAEAHAQLATSRARIVTTADTTRRRIERNLHDGAQQHLVSLALQLRAVQLAAPSGGSELVRQLDEVAAGLIEVQEELREIAHGLHPAILAERGLRSALKALAHRSAVPVRLDVRVEGRLAEPVETAAYYVVAEALTNAAKHAHATTAEVQVAADKDVLHVRVRDDGCGGADITRGSGLTGLKDRAEALGGGLALHSPPGEGTTLQVQLPMEHAGEADSFEHVSDQGHPV
ncbi:GAF domain-containing protein [Amycolatopsis sp. NPDC051372]|uniref:GAF domain-containing sensor histidine kinase n=1 Tax=unclassified Amycolatopsis TaxID=2618356 RepID=UPI00343FB27C